MNVKISDKDRNWLNNSWWLTRAVSSLTDFKGGGLNNSKTACTIAYIALTTTHEISIIKMHREYVLSSILIGNIKFKRVAKMVSIIRYSWNKQKTIINTTKIVSNLRWHYWCCWSRYVQYLINSLVRLIYLPLHLFNLIIL